MALIPIAELPTALSPMDAVEAAYPAELARCTEAIARGLSVLIECDKGLVPFYYRALRDRLKAQGLGCAWLDGRPAPDAPPTPSPIGQMAAMIAQLREAVRASTEPRVLVLPHLDLLTTANGGLTAESREVIPLLYENPQLVFVGFKDPSMAVPRVIERLFPHHEGILGVARERLRHLVTQAEARKFGAAFNPYQLYTYVSGVHAVQLRRLLAAVRGDDLPQDPTRALAQLRAATLTADLVIPDVSLERDIGGYGAVKTQIRLEILELLQERERRTDADAVARVEALVPRGMLFWGPPGTGKTLFAKAIATALGAAVTVVSGPELKSKWVGESEERLRQIFTAARQAAPAVIVFDEIDSFATARGTYTSSGVEHSMVNQLLTEMDGFRKNEMVFVVGTTNLVDAVDPALLRPGRFEFHIEIPFPDETDRREILAIHAKALDLALTSEALEYAVRRSGEPLEPSGQPWSGDHLQALCRALARERLRTRRADPTTPADVDAALEAHQRRPQLTPQEALTVATHEAGHAICALHCPNVPPIERVSIRGDLAGTLGFVQYADPAARYVTTVKQLLDGICTLYGGREAEALLLDDLSIGSAQDVERATDIARALVEDFGLGAAGARRWTDDIPSEVAKREIEEAVSRILESQRERAADLLRSHRGAVIALRDLLLAQQIVDRATLSALFEEA